MWVHFCYFVERICPFSFRSFPPKCKKPSRNRGSPPNRPHPGTTSLVFLVGASLIQHFFLRLRPISALHANMPLSPYAHVAPGLLHFGLVRAASLFSFLARHALPAQCNGPHACRSLTTMHILRHAKGQRSRCLCLHRRWPTGWPSARLWWKRRHVSSMFTNKACFHAGTCLCMKLFQRQRAAA